MNKRIQKIAEKLREASDSYYNKSEQLISDQEYDSLRDELESLDPNHAVLKQIGSKPNSKLSKVNHIIPMGSLRKVTQEDHVRTWLKSSFKDVEGKKFSLIIQWKLDGASIELYYEKGKFTRAVTRGDGFVGEDITHAIQEAKGFPKNLKEKIDCHVRGEAIFYLKDYEVYVSDNDSKNPRNAVSGTIRRLDSQSSNLVTCVAFDVISNDKDFVSEEQKISWLSRNDFNITFSQYIDVDDIENLDKIMNVISTMESQRKDLGFEVDGVVMKINETEIQKKLGEKDLIPYWARAWKFAPATAFSKIVDVEWSLGVRGTINPVAKIEPVSVGGVTITSVSLHNMDEIERLDIKIGDEVEVVRRGDVIPKIERVIKEHKNRKSISLSKCPSCGSKILRNGPFYECSDFNNCGDVHRKRIDVWISKRDIKFLGDSAQQTLHEAGLLNDIISLYSLSVEDMKEAGLGEAMSEKIYNEIEKSKQVSMSDFIGSLSLDLLGRSEAKNVVKACNIKNINQWKNLCVEDLMKHEGYQETKANRICNGIKKNWNIIEGLSKKLQIKVEEEKETAGLRFSGMTFCFTGEMNRPRKEMEGMVIDFGGEIAGVSKNLSYLVTNDINSDSSKAVKARKLGIKILSEEDFIKMINETGGKR